MNRETCKYPSCNRDPGTQDRDDYRHRQFCSVQCETKFEHIRSDAKDAETHSERHHDDAPRHDRGGRRL